MKNKKYQICLIAMIALFYGACKEIAIQPLSQGEKPDPITTYTVESLPGGAKITYDIPISNDPLYVKAKYELDNGTVREAKSSIYKNYLTVDGFGKAGEYTASIYVVSMGEVLSDPTQVKFTTLTPPYINAFNSLIMTAVFGGINVSFENKDNGDLAFGVLKIDSTNKWSPLYTYYTNSMQGDFSVRGLDTIPNIYGTFVRDRWGNLSDTLIGNYKPLYESLIENNTFSALKLPGDVWQAHGSGKLVIERAWDGLINTEFHTIPNSGMPQFFSIDMGKKVKISRFKYHQRQNQGTIFNAGNPRYFEIWGSHEPNPDGSWDSWTKIGEFESIKPSGLPIGTVSAEDRAKWIEGEDFDIPMSTPGFRFYRWKTNRTWGNVTYISIGELTFWGSVITE